MKMIQLQLTVSEVEMSPVETEMILRSLQRVVEKISLWEFQTRIGYYLEEVQSLSEKLHIITERNQPIENQNFFFSIDELIIINNALNECGYCVTDKSTEKELFQDVQKLIEQMENRS
jgi:hypothetical protein